MIRQVPVYMLFFTVRPEAVIQQLLIIICVIKITGSGMEHRWAITVEIPLTVAAPPHWPPKVTVRNEENASGNDYQ